MNNSFSWICSSNSDKKTQDRENFQQNSVVCFSNTWNNIAYSYFTDKKINFSSSKYHNTQHSSSKQNEQWTETCKTAHRVNFIADVDVFTKQRFFLKL